YKGQPYQYASSSKQILIAKAKLFPPCTHCGFNDDIPDDCRNYLSVESVEAKITLPQDTIMLFRLEEEMVENQNDVKLKGETELIEAARTMLNGLILSKHFWTGAVRTTCYTQNRSIIVKRHDKTSYEIFMERIPDISYFHVFRCPVFIHYHKDHLGKFDAKADDGYFLGYSSVSKAFRVYNTRGKQIEETYHVIFDESMEAIRFTNTLVDEI
ncbi:retrovirus-related pol polyprotein from transposon TNT 1-94, partial [Tanacetum coccineum]